MSNYIPKVYRDNGGDRMVVAAGGRLVDVSHPIVRTVRARATAAQVNAAGGYTLLSAIAGYTYRIVDMTMIAIGGNAATATSVDVVTTQSGLAARPFVVAVAALTEDTAVKPNSANVTVLAAGAAYLANDANTGVSLAKQSGGSNLATATHIDVILSYTIEEA